MNKRINGIKRFAMLAAMLAGILAGCAGGALENQSILEGKEDTFYNTVRLIMLNDELRQYRVLPDKEARQAFIEEFWRKRDPNPATPDNEFREEFQERIRYIEQWYGESVGRAGGINSDRGKVFLIFGNPDEKSASERTGVDRYGNPVNVRREVWVYDRHRLYLEFVDTQGFGVYRLPFWTPELLTAIELEKEAISQGAESGSDEKIRLTFKARYLPAEQVFEWTAPITAVSFGESDGRMRAVFKITCRITRDKKKLESVEVKEEVLHSKEELLKMETISIKIPWKAPGPGVYLADILAEDTGSGERSRGTLKFEIRRR